MDNLTLVLVVILAAALAIAAARLAWWAFRMVFWIVILLIGEAGRAWRGDP